MSPASSQPRLWVGSDRRDRTDRPGIEGLHANTARSRVAREADGHGAEPSGWPAEPRRYPDVILGLVMGSRARVGLGRVEPMFAC